MKLFLPLVALLTTLITFSQTATAANPYHVSDDVSIAMHSGPSNQFRIRGWLPSGTELTLLKRDSNTKYAQVRTSKGTVGWIDGKYLEKGNSVKTRLPVAEEKLAAAEKTLKLEQQKVVSLTEKLTNSESQRVNEVAAVNEARAAGTAQVAQLENEIVRLQNQIDSMDQTNMMGWFIKGGGVALAGIIIGLIIPNLPKKRRRTNDWF